MNWSGPVGECKLEPHALEKAVMESYGVYQKKRLIAGGIFN